MLVNLNEVLLPAKASKYAVGLFNAITLEQAKGIILAAEELNCPVIIGTAEVLLNFATLEETASILIPMAKRASVPVVVHYDHGLTLEKCITALKLGFSSIMYDCSLDTYDENIRKVAEIVRIAHVYGATVEAELGHVGDNEGSLEGDASLGKESSFYTDKVEAYDFWKRTNVDALAIAVGTAHGAYKLPPKLDFKRIEEIAHMVPIPLVLHGGSGLSERDFKEAINQGISKVNIFTDIDRAAADGVKEAFLKGCNSMTSTMAYQVEAVKNEVMKKMSLFLNK